MHIRLIIGLLLSALAMTARADTRFDDAAAVLERHCVRCHNDVDRKGDFSLQTSASLLQSDFVQPADSSSHLLTVIEPDGKQPASMPKDADPLSIDEIETIRRWILSGANWPSGATIEPPVSDFQWWSFRPITRPSIPTVESSWVRTPIDAFVLRKFNETGLTPAAAADRLALLRRLTYDLTGLPPTPDQVDAFLSDSDPTAYEQLVDRLLESEHYGEHWARHWLDVVKYADTCGYDKDKLRPNAWPYRDYVIRSLNEDKPYSRFVQEQIAGDVLFPGNPDGILGLGFIAAGPWDFIGHVEVSADKIDGKVARNLDRDEMVSNTMNTFCSVTIQCARCHNHKFDPFTQQHYYSLQAIFAAVDRAERVYDQDPAIARQRSDLQARLAKDRRDQAALAAELARAGGGELAELDKQIAALTQAAGVQKDAEFGYHSALADSSAAEKWVQLDLGRDVQAAQIILHPCHDDFGGIGAGFGFPVQYKVEIACGENAATRNWVELSATEQDVDNPGISPVMIEALGQPVRLVKVTALKLADRKDTHIFALAELRVIDAAGVNAAEHAKVSALDSIEAPPRWSQANLVDGKWARPGNAAHDTHLIELRQKRNQLAAKIETPERLSRRQRIEEAIKTTEQEIDSLPAGKLVYAAATDFEPQANFKPTLGQPRLIHLLHRGNVGQPLDQLGPGLLPTSDGDRWQLDQQTSEAKRRAALALWLTDHQNPLVWRSIVNRVWQYHFGNGLVATPNDFGRMGAAPTHPELLDWLAAEFRDGDQSLKQLHRLIVTSSVYRQSAQFDPADAAIDSGNHYLWRINRRRLSAEEIRDSVLAVSGALRGQMGGPGFYLFELEKTEHSPHYEYHKFDPADPQSHRRSIYRFVVRSQPDPYMTTLDCADSSQSTPRRIETLTSLQALSMLNNRFMLEMAQRFADRLISEADDREQQVKLAFRLVCGRSPSDEEQKQMRAYVEHHGLPNLCRMLFNLSEFVYLD